MRKSRQSEPPGSMTEIERIEHALQLAAYVVVRHGPRYAPYVDRLEKELAALRDPIARAERILANYPEFTPDGSCATIRKASTSHNLPAAERWSRDQSDRDHTSVQEQRHLSKEEPYLPLGGASDRQSRPRRRAGPMDVKRSIVVDGRKTSVSVEPEFWDALRDVSRRRRSTMVDIIAEINRGRRDGQNLSSAIRVWLIERFRTEVQSLSGKRHPEWIGELVSSM